MIEVGRLRMLERPGAAGHVIRVVDERGHHLRDATAWLGGRELRPDERGEIVVPYATQTGTGSLILRHGHVASRAAFRHLAEIYELDAAVHIEREQLLSGQMAKLILRPTLILAGRPIDIALLDDPRLNVVAVGEDGTESTLRVDSLTLNGDRDFVHELRTPPALRQIRIELRGHVRSLTTGKPVELASAETEFVLNGIDATAATSCPLLTRTAGGYAIDLRGKNGEPKPDRAISVRLRHRDYSDAFETTLKTDAQGRIELGPLDGVVELRTTGFGDGWRGWSLHGARRSQPREIHGLAGTTLRLPYVGERTTADAAGFSLLERRGTALVRDLRDRLAIVDGQLELRDLPAGDFDLWLKDEDRHIAVRTTAGTLQGQLAVGADRVLGVPAREPMRLGPLSIDGESLRIRLTGASPSTRVHVFATRYLPAFDAFSDLRGVVASPLEELELPRSATSYRSDREIGDEYRYVLDRRFAARFPGNMLRRPGLLLNPFAIEASEVSSTAWDSRVGTGGGTGGRFGGRRSERGQVTAERDLHSAATFPNLDFLPDAARVFTNLTPDEAGLISLPLAEFGDGHLIHVVALDGDEGRVYRSLTLPERALEPSPRQLRLPLEPDRHFSQHRAIDVVAGGDEAVVDDASTASLATYASLSDVYRLFRALTRDAELDRFEFLMRWPSLTPDEQRAQYAEHACHEMHLFLHQHDRAFFDAVIRPYLANKLYPDFVDDWLLDRDLGAYLEPYAYARLNAAERALLARRLPERAAQIAGDLADRVALQPADPDLARLRFATAIAGDALAASSELGMVLEEVAVAARSPADRAAPGPSGPSTPGPARAKTDGKVPAAEAEPSDREFAENAELQRERREANLPLWVEPEPTRILAEQQYLKLPLAEQGPELIDPNAFWREFAAADPSAPFVSARIAEAANDFAEMMFALAVLDLPFAAAAPTTGVDGRRLTLRSEQTMLLVRQEIRPVLAAERGAAPMLVSQNLYRLDERYRHDGERQVDAFLDHELLVDVAYGCQVVVTNPTSATRRLELLLQIPSGAIPVRNGFVTRGLAIELGGYATQAIDYAFYFPAAGPVTHYPVHVTENDALVGYAEPRSWEVLLEPRSIDTASWEHVSQSGTAEQVLAFLETANLHRIDLTRIGWRMADRDLHHATIELLRRRLHYDPLLWSYGIRHGDADVIREFLAQTEDFVESCGRSLESPLLTFGAIERRTHEHLEFAPLFNARAHRFGGQRRMDDLGAAEQYLDLLEVLRYHPRLDDVDRMRVTYYLLLQDRVGEAIDQFSRVDPQRLPGGRLQYDYMRAYLAFFGERPETAREIVAAHLDHPVERWRRLFREVVDQLDEAEGLDVARRDRDGDSGRQDALAAAEPTIDLAVEDRQIHVSWRNVTTGRINYYVVDVEFSFSSQPFAAQDASGAVFVRPNRSDELSLPDDRSELTFDLPTEFHNANVIVELQAGGRTRRQAYYANSLRLHWSENYGQVQVSDAGDGRPLPKVYVKVFARGSGGAIRFHKDGYTDLRGRFDYASVSGAAPADRFAVLVLSEEHGATIRELGPPRS